MRGQERIHLPCQHLGSDLRSQSKQMSCDRLLQATNMYVQYRAWNMLLSVFPGQVDDLLRLAAVPKGRDGNETIDANYFRHRPVER